MSGPLHVPQKPCGLAQAPHLSAPCSVICRIIYCTGACRSPHLSHWGHRRPSTFRVPTASHHPASMNSPYRISCCLSFPGRRLWYLNYCLHWQEAIISAESGRIHRSTNKKKKKSLAFWWTSCPINLTHSQKYGIYILQGGIVSLPDCTKLFSQCFFVKEEEEEEKTRESQRNY